MPSHFQFYVANFNRVRLNELIDYHEAQGRISRAVPSLVVNPLTRQFYSNMRQGDVSCPVHQGT